MTISNLRIFALTALCMSVISAVYGQEPDKSNINAFAMESKNIVLAAPDDVSAAAGVVR